MITVARERLKRPWTSSALDAATVRTALGDKASRANNALALSDQIGPILASGTKGNPRQIKRFLNTLVLRQRTAEARGFGDDVKLPVLAKLMLAERFSPASSIRSPRLPQQQRTENARICQHSKRRRPLRKAQRARSSRRKPLPRATMP
ncbi:hypothetical protein [Neomesorhizobium albiziae]|uniref:hypothetical protein n=1 Tax=Neomesorhizobium albiziae TaxID=335020 RepID=UPI00165F9904|nr:hypothetical protein [Mesorhizobium albiziae]GLS32584.1 hypothetical protein GCM10007937_42940 [Mesorhizobium albiziae]